jgi:hypothetical protein
MPLYSPEGCVSFPLALESIPDSPRSGREEPSRMSSGISVPYVALGRRIGLGRRAIAPELGVSRVLGHRSGYPER